MPHFVWKAVWMTYRQGMRDIVTSMEWIYVFDHEAAMASRDGASADALLIGSYKELIVRGRRVGQITWTCNNFIETHSLYEGGFSKAPPQSKHTFRPSL